MRNFVDAGVVEKFLLWDPANIGYASAYLAVGLKEGTIELGEGKTFKAGKLGEVTFGPNKLAICGPPFIFDKDNIGEFNF